MQAVGSSRSPCRALALVSLFDVPAGACSPMRLIGWPVLVLSLALGCSAEEDGGGGGRSAAGAPAAPGSEDPSAAAGSSGGEGPAATGLAGSPAENGERATGASDAGAGDGDAPCNQVGITRLCCGTGVQTCEGGEELPIWGPCRDGSGVEIVCGDCATNELGPGCDAGVDAGPPPPPPPEDAGTPDSGPPPGECGPGMVCKPESIRYCDQPGMEWSVSTCDASGQWGPCVATTVPVGAIGCAQNDYAPELCCPVLQLCCQNDNGPFVDFGSGACAAISCP